MLTGYQVQDPAATYFLTLQVVDWVDVFTRKTYRDIVLESLSYCRQHKGLEVYAYVIMSNHVHLMVRARKENLPDVLRDFKKFTASRILKQIAESDVESRSEWMLKRPVCRPSRICRSKARSELDVSVLDARESWGGNH